MEVVVKRNLQNEILTLLMTEHKIAEFYFLNNSIVRSTKGIVISFDEFRINIDSFGKQLSIYKQSLSYISSLSVNKNINRPRSRPINSGTTHSEIRTWQSL